MKDPQLFLMLCVAVIVFTAVAAYAPRATDHISRRTNARPPHRSLVTALRVWFAMLAAASFWLLVSPLFLKAR